MPKHAILNVKNSNDKFDYIFVHHADDIELILPQYNTLEFVREIMLLGDLSALKKELHPPQGAEHTYKAPIPNVTIAYHRDCGYPKGSCFHLNNPEPKQKMDYEYDFEDKTSVRDRDLQYFIFDDTWKKLDWQPRKWSKNIIP